MTLNIEISSIVYKGTKLLLSEVNFIKKEADIHNY